MQFKGVQNTVDMKKRHDPKYLISGEFGSVASEGHAGFFVSTG